MHLSHLMGRNGHLKLPKISREYRINQTHLKSGAKSSTITNMSFSMQIPRACPLIQGHRMNFLPLIEPNPTDSRGSQQMLRILCLLDRASSY
jgi:hypothetical protein